MAGVDWCDAYAFCAWAGKRLCGRIGGGSGVPSDFNDATKSQWYAACISEAAGNVYPYGNSYTTTTCNGGDNGVADFVPVKSMTGCHWSAAPYSSIYDMSGNADEWEDTCTQAGGIGANDPCRARGGNYLDSQLWLRCDADWMGYNRSDRFLNVGFRCCS